MMYKIKMDFPGQWKDKIRKIKMMLKGIEEWRRKWWIKVTKGSER